MNRFGRWARDKRVRDIARNVPGLSHAFWSTRRWLIIRRGIARLDYDGAALQIAATSREVVDKRMQPYAKEPWTVEWLIAHVRPGDVLYDIGANVGSYSLIAATLAADVTVIAFEPAPANYHALCENAARNGLQARITALPVVLAERTRLAFLEADSTVGATHSLVDPGSNLHSQPALAYALDDLISTFELPAPSLVKLDVDGAETLVLDGAVRTLASPSLRSVLAEIGVALGDAVLERLTSAGFRLVRRYDERAGKPLPEIWYGIFERGDA